MDFKTYVQNVVASYVENPDRNIIFIKDVHINRIISNDDIDANDTITDDDLRQGFEMWNSSINL